MRFVWFVLFAAGCVCAGERSPAEKAIAAAQAAVAKSPDSVDGYNALAMALARRARETAGPEYYGQAEEAVKKALAIDPDNFEALKTRCWVLLGKHEFPSSLALAKQLNKRMPDDATVYGLLADAHAELGNYKEAEEAAQWMLDMSRSGIPALTRAAHLREIFGDIEGAMDLMRTAYTRIGREEHEDRAWTLVQMGHLLTVAGKLEEADTTFQEALKLFPDYHYALAGLAKARAARGEHGEAAKLMRRRYELAPHPENLFDVAAALASAGRAGEASEAFAEFEKLALAESEGWDNANRELIAYYADHAGKPEEALRLAKREIARRRDVATIDAYAWALHRAGYTAQAREEIAKALAIGTADPSIRKHANEIAAAFIASR